jgi:multiple sugar transport system substrate-binding protein
MAAFGQPIINIRSNGDTYFCASVDGEEYRPMFLSEAAYNVADFLIELIEYSPPNIFSMSWYERAKCYANGECAMAYCYSLLASLFLNDNNSPAQKVTGFLPHPAGPRGQPIAPVGGYAVAIPSNIETDRIQDAWTALRTLTSAEAVKQFVLNGSTSSPRLSVGGDPEVFAICPLISQIDQMARQGLVQYWPRPPIPELQEIVSILGQEIFPMLHGQTSVKDALITVQNRCDALMRANGHY